MNPISELIELLARLPGIGHRTATRLAFHILTHERDYAASLGHAIAGVHERIRQCEECGNFSAETRCNICKDSHRDPKLLCVVARVQDLIAIENSSTFGGRYHVLHKLLAPLDGVGPDELPLDALIERVIREGIEEIIVATPLSVEGEATSLYIAQAMKDLDMKVSRIASGIPHGGELEFTDQVTLGRAFNARHEL